MTGTGTDDESEDEEREVYGCMRGYAGDCAVDELVYPEAHGRDQKIHGHLEADKDAEEILG